MTLSTDARELSAFEIDQIAGGPIILPPIVLPWPNGPILTGTGPDGGDPLPEILTRQD
jgi:hypothetical protein